MDARVYYVHRHHGIHGQGVIRVVLGSHGVSEVRYLFTDYHSPDDDKPHGETFWGMLPDESCRDDDELFLYDEEG